MIETKEISTSWDMIRKIFEESVPFHKSLGFRVVGLESGTPRVHIDLQEKFVANFIRGNLHGGVISILLDVIGGIVAFVDVTERKNIKTSEANSNSFQNGHHRRSSRLPAAGIRKDIYRYCLRLTYRK